MKWFRDLVTVAFLPRQTMRRVLDRGGAPVLPLVIVAVLSMLVADFSVADLRRAMAMRDEKTIGMVTAVVICAALLEVALFYAFSWLAFYTGRFLEGQATTAQVRVAMAWGLMPMIWALLYRIPFALLRPATQLPSPGIHVFVPSGSQISVAITMTVAKWMILAWYIFVTSQTLAEAQRFSGWRGLATMAILAAIPLVIVAAAVLAMST
jgi:Yip1-like protein